MLGVIAGDRINRHARASGIADESSGMVRNALFLVAGQLLYLNIFLAPFWISGLVSSARGRLGGDARFLGVAYGILLAIAIVSVGRPYYIFGIYPALFAAGGVVVERWTSGHPKRRVAPAAPTVALAAAFVSIALPV